jgi:Zn-dependent protease
MNLDVAGLIQFLALAAIPVTFAITLHEAAHGYAARHFGDCTAHDAGRISLNPLRHIDPMGTIAVPLLIWLGGRLSGGGDLLFGWAKPVPVNFGRLRNPKRDMLWVAAAGPAANLAMLLAWALILKVVVSAPETHFSSALIGMSAWGIKTNLVLMVLNLLPLPPLDGGRIMVSLLPGRMAWRFAMLEPYGFIILLVLLFTGVLSALLNPVKALVLGGIWALFHLS